MYFFVYRNSVDILVRHTLPYLKTLTLNFKNKPYPLKKVQNTVIPLTCFYLITGNLENQQLFLRKLFWFSPVKFVYI